MYKVLEARSVCTENSFSQVLYKRVRASSIKNGFLSVNFALLRLFLSFPERVKLAPEKVGQCFLGVFVGLVGFEALHVLLKSFLGGLLEAFVHGFVSLGHQVANVVFGKAFGGNGWHDCDTAGT